MRLFFALMPDERTRSSIAAAAGALKAGVPVRAEDYHMTLAFLGEAPDEKLAAIKELGASQCARSFSVRLDAYDYWREARVIVAAATAVPEPLRRLWESVHADLAKHHLALEPAPFKAHITLAKKVSQPPVLPAMSAFDWCARSFSLLRSETGGAQSRYTVLETWPLLDERASR